MQMSGQGLVDRAFVGDFQQRRPVVVRQFTLQSDLFPQGLDLVPGHLWMVAVFGMVPVVRYRHFGMVQRDALARRIEMQGHHRATGERSAQIIVGRGAHVRAAIAGRLIGDEGMAASPQLRPELPVSRFRHHTFRGCLGFDLRQVTGRPSGDDACGISGLVGIGQQMVCLVQRNETLRMDRRLEQFSRIVDPDNLVARSMQQKERQSKNLDGREQVRLPDGVQERTPKTEWPPSDADFAMPLGFDRCEVAFHIPKHMRHVGGCADGRHADRSCYPLRRRQHGGPAQAVTDQQDVAVQLGAQPIRRGDDIVDVACEAAIAEVAFRSAQAGKVEAQRCDPLRRQRAGHLGRGLRLLGAGKAVREQRRRTNSPRRQFQRAHQHVAAASFEFDPLYRHVNGTPEALVIGVYARTGTEAANHRGKE